MVNMLREDGYVETDEYACYEFDVFEKKQNGSFGAMDGHHDDVLMTRLIGCYVSYSQDIPVKIEKTKKYFNKPILNESSI